MTEDEALAQLAKAQCWRLGSLDYLRHEGQQLIDKTISDSSHREHFLLCSRRFGKSYEGILRGFEVCLKAPLSKVLYMAPYAEDGVGIATDTVVRFLPDCQADITPEWRSGDREFLFKNGSRLRIRGTNNDTAGRRRGGEAHLIVLDECGQMDDLENIVEGVLRPMTLTTKGRIVYLTTPPDSPDHYSMRIFDKLHEKGATSLFTLADAPHIEYEEKARILVDHGEKPERIADMLSGKALPQTNYVQREYWCMRVVDTNRAVVPEFARHKSEIVVDDYPRPAHFNCYGAADMGMRDRTGILSAYLDFVNQRLIVEGELLLNRANTATVAVSWGELEAELGYTDHKVLRVIDDPSLRVSADLTALGLTAMPAMKPGREAAVAAMRVAITSGRIRILSRCKLLIHQLETAIYKKSESGKSYDFERDAEGHFDLVDALIYLVRSTIWNRNPYPPGWQHTQIQANSSGLWTASPKAFSRLNQSVFGGTPAGRRLLKGGKR